MYTTIGKKTHYMKIRIIFYTIINCRIKTFILKKRFIFNTSIDFN